MKHRPWLIAALVFLSAPSTAAAQEFGWFAQLVGSCWRGVFPDGITSHRQCYTRQFEKFVRGTAELRVRRDGNETVQFQGDSLFTWNPSAKSIDYYIWGSDGSHRQLAAQYVGEELHFPVPSRQDPSKVAFRSVWKRLDESSFEVRRERPLEAGWSVELRVVYRKEA